jgi:starch phosphorylase
MLDYLDVWNPNPLPPLPEPLQRLGDLAYNLWWSWQPEARALFEDLDSAAWDAANHNPVLLLRRLPSRRLREAAADEDYVARLRRVLADFDGYMSAQDTPFARAHPAAAALPAAVAYFSAEFGVHESLAIYSGGLGVLAGDHCKAASDYGLPLVGVGLLYPQGYFSQTIDEAGRQEAHYEKLSLGETPLRPAVLRGEPVLVEFSLAARPIRAQVWYVRVGRVVLLLLDTDIPTNPPRDREVGYKLYGGGPGNRLRQEMVLGLGGAQALAKLGLTPPVWHLNEGHAAFAPLERIRQRVAEGESFAVAQAAVAAGTVFTTHTPVRAGHDEFAESFILAHFDGYARQLRLGEEELLALARRVHDGEPHFSMTTLAFRLSAWHNAVSQLHGTVTREMWHDLWPDRSLADVPVMAITNGVHRPTWLSSQMSALVAAVTGPDQEEDGLPDLRPESLAFIPDEALWTTHQALKARMITFIRHREQLRRERLGLAAEVVAAADRLLDPNALTLGFARRFATYKRALLLFHDPERLAAILNRADRPIQLVYAGKAHPADQQGQAVLAELVAFSQQPAFAGRVVVVEGYDMGLARLLTHGVDVWLNTPRRPQEACGTSGMKAALNGVPNLSVMDGWWAEGYRGDNGWAVSGEDAGGEAATDARDAAEIYRLLDDEVAPAFYASRDEQGLPQRWLPIMRAAMITALERFTGERMVSQYVDQCYLPALDRVHGPAEPAAP